MTESTPVNDQPVEPSVAERRRVLQEAGFPVGSRGTLSAAAQEKYNELTAR